jgi:hypothetical protein
VSDALLDDKQVLDVQLELADDPGSRQAEVDLKIAISTGAGVREMILDLDDLDVPLPQYRDRAVGHGLHVGGMVQRH